MRYVRSGSLMVCVGLLAGSLMAQDYRNMSSVHDGSGRMSTSTVAVAGVNYYHVSAAGQPGGIATSTNGTLVNNAGFLQAVDIKFPNLDTDGDGVINEISQDNDGDMITDLGEIEGTNFNPTTETQVNVADTDGDGVIDGNEMVAGTNPTNENAYLRIVSIEKQGEDRVVAWTARGDGVKEYKVRMHDDTSYDTPTSVLVTTTVSGGVAPWYETTASYTNAAVSSNRYYAVEVLP